MAAFDYKALNPSGEVVRGTLAADSLRSARSDLRRQSLTPLEVHLSKTGRGRFSFEFDRGQFVRSVSPREVATLTRQLATLIGAAMPVEQALKIVADQSDEARQGKRLQTMRSEVIEGRRLSQAMEGQGDLFSPLYCAIVAAGETTGNLGDVLSRLADYMERREEIRRKLMTALIYPLVLGVTALLVVVALMVFVVPRVVEQFASMGQQLPFLTRFMIGLSEFLQAWGLLLLPLGLLLGWVGHRLLQDPKRRVRADGLLLSMPFLGGLIAKVEAARFSRTLASLIGSGVPTLASFEAAEAVVGNQAIRLQVKEAVYALKEGASVSKALGRASFLPPLVLHMVVAGQNSGSLPTLLERAAAYLEDDFEVVTDAALSLLEPGIIILMGGVVAMIVLSILLPILQFNSLAMS